MTVFGRLGTLLVVLCGAALLIVDPLRSPPGLWYAAIGIITGTTMIAYIAISSLFLRSPQPAPKSTYSRTYDESKTTSTTSVTDSQPVDAPQTAGSTKSGDREPQPTTDENTEPSEPPTSDEKLGPSSTTLKRPQYLLETPQTMQRSASYTHLSQTKKTAGWSIRQNRHVTSIASPRQNSSTGIENEYFKPVDLGREIKFAQIDTRFSFLDIDLGPEFIGLDPIPDLVEIDIGPSAVSKELVRSPVEIKISSFIKALLTPTPRSYGTAELNDNVLSSSDNHAHRQTDDRETRRRLAPADTHETRYSDQDRYIGSRYKPLTGTYGQQESVEKWLMSPGLEHEKHRPTTADKTGYGIREEIGGVNDERSNEPHSFHRESVVEEVPLEPRDMGVADETGVDMGMNYSLPRWGSTQWNADPFGLNDIATGFSEPEESVIDPIEQPELGYGMSDRDTGMLSEEPVVDPDAGAEMFGLDEFSESLEGRFDLSVSDVNGSNPLFPEAESFLLDEAREDDWLRF
jgi:hypothetical protein